MRVRRLKKYFSLSLFVHIAIVLYLIFTFSFSNTINENQTQALPIYIYSMANTTPINKPPMQDTQKTPAQENNQPIIQNTSQITTETNKPVIQENHKSIIQEEDKSTIQKNNEPVIEYNSRLVAQETIHPEQSNPIEWITSPQKSSRDKDEEDNSINQQEVQSSSNSVKLDQQILQILHESITNKQYYPEEALAGQQKGIVKIKFLLFPDGHLENISVVTSSGSSSLDLAAIQIVESISPDKKAGAFLQQAKFFYVDIIFEQ